MSHRVTVIGDGGMGTICAIMLAENGHAVRLWSAFEEQAEFLREHRVNKKFLPEKPLPDGIEVISGREGVFDDTAWILSAVPTQFVRTVWEGLKDVCPADTPICSVTKGIENDTLLRPSEILLEVLGNPDRTIAVLSGPSIAPEIARELPATVTVACSEASFARQVQECISTRYFRVYTNLDVVGVELAGATKNVIAIAAGALDGMGAGVNAKAALLTRGLVEISRLGVAAGAKPETFAGLSGLGDLVTTCFSPVGRNRCFGEAIGTGKSVEEALAEAQGVVEGVATTRSMVALAKKLGVEMPLTQAVYDVVVEGKDRQETITDLMTRPLRSEME
ncbi:MAG: NAD(P)-dependent glycerol-3-phosphate dehydrogenase [Phycisphaerae bacterium]|nr:NAD(P)-dependent glycerol-3-phosphate dehydrogenase [Phycisphaerae bacterium]